MTDAEQKYADGMTPDLHPVQIEAYRRMTAEEKLQQMTALYWMARKMKMTALKSQHSDWTDSQIVAETSRIFLHANTG